MVNFCIINAQDFVIAPWANIARIKEFFFYAFRKCALTVIVAIAACNVYKEIVDS